MHRGCIKTLYAARKASRDATASTRCSYTADARASGSLSHSAQETRIHQASATTLAPPTTIHASSRFIAFRIRTSAITNPSRDGRNGFQTFFKSSGRIGRRRRRLPVTAKMAFASAGATGGTPGSPTPPILSVVSTM